MHKTFSDIIVDNFQEIQRNFKIGLKNKGYQYDEDILNDAFISCCKSLKDKVLTEKEAIKYYWTSYINKYKTKVLSKHQLILESEMEEYDFQDEKYDDTIDKIYSIIIKAIQDKFGVRDAYIWDLYVCQGKTSKYIRNMGFNVDNFVYFTRKIKRYILNHVIPNNQELKELIKYRKEA